MKQAATYLFLILVHVGLWSAVGTRVHHRAGANPVHKVIAMLQAMERKVREEGEKREKLFDKYMCYCKTGVANLETSILAASERIPQLESQIQEAEATKQQLTEELRQHRIEKEEATKAIADANSLKDSQAQSLGNEQSQLRSNIQSVQRAVAALNRTRSGDGRGFLQVTTAQELQRLSVAVDMSGSDRDLLSNYLAGNQASTDPNEVLGILKQMKETMTQELQSIEKSLEESNANQEGLISAKQLELGASNKAIEDKARRNGDVSVKLVALKNDHKDTSEALEQDQKFVADLRDSCKAKKSEWEDYQKEQAAESIALADTIKILNDEDANELFAKSLPATSATSFLQLEDSQEGTRHTKALTALHSMPHSDPRVKLLELAVRGQKRGFASLISMIDELLSALAAEQREDDNKQVFCNSEIARAEDELKATKRSSSDKVTIIDDLKDSLEELNRSITALLTSIKELDAQVTQATANRKAEHQESVDILAETSTAKSLLELAKSRLVKFYGKRRQKTPGNAEPAMLVQEQQTPGTPAPDLSYKRNNAENVGVLSMLDLLRKDLVKRSTLLETEEKVAQASYERFMKESTEKRAVDSKAVADKEKNKAELEASLIEEKDNLAAYRAETVADAKELSSLHGECDWLLHNYDLRKQARTDEADALEKAKAVLAGADST